MHCCNRGLLAPLVGLLLLLIASRSKAFVGPGTFSPRQEHAISWRSNSAVRCVCVFSGSVSFMYHVIDSRVACWTTQRGMLLVLEASGWLPFPSTWRKGRVWPTTATAVHTSFVREACLSSIMIPPGTNRELHKKKKHTVITGGMCNLAFAAHIDPVLFEYDERRAGS